MKIKEIYSESQILEDIKLGGSRTNVAVSFMFREFYALLENYIIRNSGNEDDAADIIQETFLVFIKIVEDGKFRQDSSIKSILYSICRNLWITEIRKRKSTMTRHETYETEKDGPLQDFSESLAKHEDHKLVMNLFRSLGEKCKNILRYFYYENLSMKEIMEKEEFSSEQVLRNKKHKCMKSLIEKVQADQKLFYSLKNALQNGE